MVQFGDALQWTFVMGGLAREVGAEASDRSGATGTTGAGARERAHARLVRSWLDVAHETETPIDPLVWIEGPLSTTYPACMAVRAASEQADDGGYRYLRRLREAVMCERRKLDHVEALVEEARSAGLDVERFRIDLRSHAITEAFGVDLEETRGLAERDEVVWTPSQGSEGRERLSRGAGGTPIPTLVFRGEAGPPRAVSGFQPYRAYREAAVAAGAEASGDAPPGVEELVERFGRVTTREVEEICELPGPRAGAELYRLAEQWKLRPLRRMTGYLWERA
jgi:protein-disulfide isomerase-like protein with CxxC motif